MSKEDIEIFVIRIYNNSRDVRNSGDIAFAVKYRNTCILGGGNEFSNTFQMVPICDSI